MTTTDTPATESAEPAAASGDRVKPPAAVPPPVLLVKREGGAAMLNVGCTTFDDLNKLKLCPAPVRIPPARRGKRAGVSGGSPRWRVDDLKLWAELGCPDRRTFEAEKKARERRSARRRA